jgi:hypothetical protein
LVLGSALVELSLVRVLCLGATTRLKLPLLLRKHLGRAFDADDDLAEPRSSLPILPSDQTR